MAPKDAEYNRFPFDLVHPLCGCTGGAESCGKRNDCMGEELPPHPISAVPASTRGPVSADNYEPDQSDPIDVELGWHLVSLDHAALPKLMVQRLDPGEYKIDGRHVCVHWGSFAPGPCRSTELLVSEEQEDGDWDSVETPLPVYLRQALDVVAALRGQTSGAPAVARVPPNERLSFFNLPMTQVVDKDIDNERLTCMKRACEEARLREEAVEVFESRQMVQSESIPPLIPLANDPRDTVTPFKQRANGDASVAMSYESRMPPMPKQKGALSPSSSGSSVQKPHSRFPAAYANLLCSSNSRLPSAPAPPPVACFSRMPCASRVPATPSRIRKV
jgi:hypothetical protein